jgi:hypothetical protein
LDGKLWEILWRICVGCWREVGCARWRSACGEHASCIAPCSFGRARLSKGNVTPHNPSRIYFITPTSGSHLIGKIPTSFFVEYLIKHKSASCRSTWNTTCLLRTCRSSIWIWTSAVPLHCKELRKQILSMSSTKCPWAILSVCASQHQKAGF